MRRRVLVVLLFYLGMSGCGFHLRGVYRFPEFLSSIDLVTPKDATALRQQLERALERNNVLIQTGGYQLVIQAENITSQTSIFDVRSQIMNTHLIYTLSYVVISPDQREHLQGRPIVEQRDYQSSPGSISGGVQESDLAVSDMREDAVQQLLRRLQSLRKQRFNLPPGAAWSE